MKADQIIKNAKIFTADSAHPKAAALAVKDGKFVYVGDEAGLADFEGEVTDLGGKFIMPGIIDSHIHITTGVGFEYVEYGEWIGCSGKQAALDFMAEYIRKNPGLERYRFMMERASLNGEDFTKEDLDAICPDAELQILESEVHSIWVNSKILEKHGITDDTPDPAPGLAYYVRKDGHVTGNAYESAGWPFVFDWLKENLTDEQIASAVARWIEFSKKEGVSCVFDAASRSIMISMSGSIPICAIWTDRENFRFMLTDAMFSRTGTNAKKRSKRRSASTANSIRST